MAGAETLDLGLLAEPLIGRIYACQRVQRLDFSGRRSVGAGAIAQALFGHGDGVAHRRAIEL